MVKKRTIKKSNYTLWIWIAGGAGGSILLLLLLLLLLPYPQYTQGFQTLNELEAYSKKIEENRKTEGKNLIVVEFTKYLQDTYSLTFGKKLKHKFRWLMYLIGLQPRPYWNNAFYKNILEEITTSREKNGLTGGKFIQKIEANSEQKFVIFGDIYGAFHSLARYLFKLKDLGIIDENFKFTSPHYHLVFLGNLNGLTPYSLETHSIVLRLLKENPNNIFFLRSRTAHFDKWQRQPIRDELIFKMRSIIPADKEEIPCKELLNRFFETLPSALYLTLPKVEEKAEYVRFSPFRLYNNDNSEAQMLERLDESRYAAFLKDKQKETIDIFHLKNQAKEEQDAADDITMKAVVSLIVKRDEYQPTNGLRLLPPDRGATAWTVLSSPTPAMQKAGKFYYDAFAIITTAKKTEDWKITLYNRDIRKEEGFKETTQKFFAQEEKAASQEKKSPKDKDNNKTKKLSKKKEDNKAKKVNSNKEAKKPVEEQNPSKNQTKAKKEDSKNEEGKKKETTTKQEEKGE